MYEYEFWCAETHEFLIFFGYSLEDVKRRNPHVDFDKLLYTNRWYVD